MLVGASLDAGALMIIWSLLDAIGPLDYKAEYWLDVLGLAAVPWFIHVIALPAAFHLEQIGTNRLLARTAGFCGLVVLLVPTLGITTFYVIGLPLFVVFYLVDGGAALAATASADWIDRMLNDGFLTIIATIAGLAIGFLLHAFRPVSTTERPALHTLGQPRMRSDVLGGAAAAFLTFGGMFLALPFGLFTRPLDIPTDWMHQLASTPQLSASIIIGVVALMPHLLLVGGDLFSSDGQREEA
jgi:hypothetical protein